MPDQPRIQVVPDMGQYHRLWLQLINALQGQVQVIAIARGPGLRWHGAIQHQHIPWFTPQPAQSVWRQTYGVGQVGDSPPFSFQQLAEGRFRMLQRQHSDAERTDLPGFETLERLAEIESSEVFVEVGQAFRVHRTAHRNHQALAPAHMQQTLGVMHGRRCKR